MEIPILNLRLLSSDIDTAVALAVGRTWARPEGWSTGRDLEIFTVLHVEGLGR